MKALALSWSRMMAVLVKEFIQMRRDRLTFAMIVGIPLLQLVLFGYAINADPKALPTALVAADQGIHARNLVQAVERSGYFRFTHRLTQEAPAERLLASGAVQFVLVIPSGFGRAIERGPWTGERPVVAVLADATDPAATGNALAALNVLGARALLRDAPRPAGTRLGVAADEAPFEWRVHRRYNPEGITQYNIVPGLLGVILQMTMVMMTAFAVTRERERGTMENLLATPVQPLEVMAGKILPYVVVGLVQMAIILGAARLLFDVPMLGSLTLLLGALMLYIAALLALGFAFSTVARNQLQAMQMTFFFFLPSLLLSGFMFPFRGMPQWAQWLGEIFPLTHFLRIVRGVLLKGSDLAGIWPDLWPIGLFLAAAGGVALLRYRQTLD
jgi:ABC-2 type transport system permease protein